MNERPIAVLEDELTEGSARIDAALCAWLLTLAEFDRRSGYERWECRSAAHFLNWRCGISMVAARERVRVARRLEELPLVRAHFADGTLSYSKVRAIAKIATPETEAVLVEWAAHATAAQLDKIVQGRQSVNEKAGPETFVDWHYDDDGNFMFRGKLTPEEGALFVAALQSSRKALAGEEDDSAESSKPTNADALTAMAETVLAQGPTPMTAGDRNVVLVHVNAETGEARLDDGPVLSEASRQHVMCSASWAPVIRGSEGEVLFLGRTSRDPNRVQRRALKLRDGGCVFPGCTQRIWVDAHHIVPWEQGGLTDIDNLVLLCRSHHTAVHHRGFSIERLGNQRVRFFDASGIELDVAPTIRASNGAIPTTGASGRAITPATSIPTLDWRDPSYADAVESLCWLEENAHKLDQGILAPLGGPEIAL